MATPKPIIFRITEAGRLAVLDAKNQGLSLSLATLAAGTAKYTATGTETRLKSEAIRTNIVTSGIEKESKTLRFSATINSPNLRTIHELGLFTKDNKLFAIATSTSDPLFTVYANVAFVGSFGLSLADVDINSITVSTDPDGEIAIAMMEKHLAAPNPHPQYASKKELSDIDKKIIKINENANKAGGNLAKHIKAADPHSQYLLKTTHNAHIQNYNAHVKDYEAYKKKLDALKDLFENHEKADNPHSQYALKKDLEAHKTAKDPYPQYATDTDIDGLKQTIEALKKEVQKLLNRPSIAIPVGGIFETTKNYKSGTEVAKDMGYGTWKRFAEGLVTVGISTKSSDPKWTKTINKTFGEYDHQLTIDEMPRHKHTLQYSSRITGGGNQVTGSYGGGAVNRSDEGVFSSGDNRPHNNVQPSVVVGKWLRTT